jgi:hypothetical protein
MSQTAIPLTDDANAGAIVNDSAWFPIDLELVNETFEFVKTSPEELAGEFPASQLVWRPQGARHRLSLSATQASWPDAAPIAANFIWNTGCCDSVLISRALQKAGVSTSVRDPDILSRLADMKRARVLGETKFQRMPRTVFGLLSRPMAAEAATIITGSPQTSILADEAARLTSGKMLFLYADLRTFLISVNNESEIRRGFYRRMFSAIAGDGHEQATWPVANLFQMTDLQIAALVWHMQMTQFRRAMAVLGPRAASLDADVFLQSPKTTLMRLDDFFGLNLGADFIDETVKGPLLRPRSEDGRAADLWERHQKYLEINPVLSGHIDQIVAKSYEICKAPHGVPLPNALIPTDKAYP